LEEAAQSHAPAAAPKASEERRATAAAD